MSNESETPFSPIRTDPNRFLPPEESKLIDPSSTDGEPGAGEAFLAIQESHSGPLPHPSILRGYEDVCPGAADRVIRMAEQRAMHRETFEIEQLRGAITLQGRVITEESQITRRGQDRAFGYVFVLAILPGGLAYLQQPILSGISIASISKTTRRKGVS